MLIFISCSGNAGKFAGNFSKIGMLDAAICNKQQVEGLAARKNALFQAVRHGIGPDVAMLLSLSFAVGDEDDSDKVESDEGDII